MREMISVTRSESPQAHGDQARGDGVAASMHWRNIRVPPLPS
jgi:hypothetical protein